MSNYARKQDITELFIEVYKAYPSSFILESRTDINKTNSIILPSSALAKLSNLSKFISYFEKEHLNQNLNH